MLSRTALVTVGEQVRQVTEGGVVVNKPDEPKDIQNQSRENLIFWLSVPHFFCGKLSGALSLFGN